MKHTVNYLQTKAAIGRFVLTLSEGLPRLSADGATTHAGVS
tara:strand:+ start:1205 stop:1327 length:123 start_codon:yes stop_codon:yes gene_type:complete